MRRNTTPTLEVHVDGTDLRGCWYRVTLAQRGGASITKDQTQCELSEDGTDIALTLTQAETKAFAADKPLRIQVRFGPGPGVAHATEISQTTVGEILDEVEV